MTNTDDAGAGSHEKAQLTPILEIKESRYDNEEQSKAVTGSTQSDVQGSAVLKLDLNNIQSPQSRVGQPSSSFYAPSEVSRLTKSRHRKRVPYLGEGGGACLPVLLSVYHNY